MSRLACFCAAIFVSMSAPALAQTQPDAQPAPAQPSQPAPIAPTQAAPWAQGQTIPATPAQATPAVQAPADAPSPVNNAAPAAVPAVADAVPAQAAPSVLPHALTPWGMFMAADIVVKAVMLGLLFASLVTWTIGIAKALQLMVAQRKATAALKAVNAAASLDEAASIETAGGDPALLVSATRAEVRMSVPAFDHVDHAGVKERVASRLGRIEAAAGRNMMRGTGLLATIGSTAPFVGLFGTVWGIMNSFIGISQAQTTNLAIVAPGIAEALLATAIGLVAAIPAVVIYNMFVRAISAYRQGLADISAGLERLVSRDLDFRSLPRLRAVAE